MPAEPAAHPLLLVSLYALPVFADIERSTSATVTLLDVCNSASLITCTGLGPSSSARLMFEPVTTMVGISLLSSVESTKRPTSLSSAPHATDVTAAERDAAIAARTKADT